MTNERQHNDVVQFHITYMNDEYIKIDVHHVVVKEKETIIKC